MQEINQNFTLYIKKAAYLVIGSFDGLLDIGYGILDMGRFAIGRPAGYWVWAMGDGIWAMGDWTPYRLIAS